MYKVRLVYSKSKESMYLSHLDIMEVFARTFRRANIPICYSKGFNPRPEIVFAHPLSVGIESTGEILEVMLLEELNLTYFIKELNNYLPKSITILSAEYANLSDKSIMARVYAAIYTIEFCYNEEDFKDKDNRQIDDIKEWYRNKMLEYLSQDFLLVLKKSKTRSERVDIKPLIISYEFLLDGKLEVTVFTGSKNNLKPEYIMIGFNEYINKELEYNIKREKILFK